MSRSATSQSALQPVGRCCAQLGDRDRETGAAYDACAQSRLQRTGYALRQQHHCGAIWRTLDLTSPSYALAHCVNRLLQHFSYASVSILPRLNAFSMLFSVFSSANKSAAFQTFASSSATFVGSCCVVCVMKLLLIKCTRSDQMQLAYKGATALARACKAVPSASDDIA